MNKVTKESIEAKIKDVTYTKLTDKLTHCLIVMENGFQVTGESACVDPKNYDQEIGERIAYENAFNKLWEVEGYLLQEKLHLKKVFEDKFPKWVIHPNETLNHKVFAEDMAEVRDKGIFEWFFGKESITEPVEKNQVSLIKELQDFIEKEMTGELKKFDDTFFEMMLNGMGAIVPKTPSQEKIQKFADELNAEMKKSKGQFLKEYPMTSDQAFKISLEDRADEVTITTKNGNYRLNLRQCADHRKILNEILAPYSHLFDQDNALNYSATEKRHMDQFIVDQEAKAGMTAQPEEAYNWKIQKATDVVVNSIEVMNKDQKFEVFQRMFPDCHNLSAAFDIAEGKVMFEGKS